MSTIMMSLKMINPLDIVGNMSSDKTSLIDPFVNGENIASIANIANIASSANIANIANGVMDPLADSANFKDGGFNPLANISAVDPFFVQPDLPNWVVLPDAFHLECDHDPEYDDNCDSDQDHDQLNTI